MEEQIGSLLQTNPDEMKEYITRFDELLCNYERTCYRNSKLPDLDLIDSWMLHMKEKIITRGEKKKMLTRREDAEDKNVFDTLALLVSQVESADKNILLLENSNIKLTSLSHNSKSLEKELIITQEMIKKSKDSELHEVKRVYYSFTLFILTLFYVLISRLSILKITYYFGGYCHKFLGFLYNQNSHREEL